MDRAPSVARKAGWLRWSVRRRALRVLAPRKMSFAVHRETLGQALPMPRISSVPLASVSTLSIGQTGTTLMPIRRELRSLYPPDWPALSDKIRFERAGGRCQSCGRPHKTIIRCLPDGRWFDPDAATWRDGRGRPSPWPDLIDATRMRTTRVVLAAAHLDGNPANNRLRNLRSLCQRCHVRHDIAHHTRQRWITYRRRYAIGDLFLGLYDMILLREWLRGRARGNEPGLVALLSMRRKSTPRSRPLPAMQRYAKRLSLQQ